MKFLYIFIEEQQQQNESSNIVGFGIILWNIILGAWTCHEQKNVAAEQQLKLASA